MSRTTLQLAALVIACATVAVPPTCIAKPKKKPAAPPPSAPVAPEELPTDLNLASLRLSAMESLYELDASVEQLRTLRSAADGLADHTERSTPKAAPKLSAAMVNLRDALLNHGEDEKVSTARDAVAEASADVDIDDTIHVSPAAKSRATTITRIFTAGQLAAYLASHADEVVGPGERMATAIADLQGDPPEEADNEIRMVADEVGQLVAGADAVRASAAAGKAVAWLRANRSADTTTADARAKLESSARSAVGDVPAVEVLGHWFDGEIAQLLANPQFPDAATALLSAHENGAHVTP